MTTIQQTPESDNPQFWQQTLASLKLQTTTAIFDQLLKPLKAERIADGTLYLSTAGNGIKVLEAQWKARILDAIPKAEGIADVVFSKTESNTDSAEGKPLDAPVTVDQADDDNERYDGFDMPSENWVKLPVSYINELDRVNSLAESKVILYVLRHTWGWQDERKKITMDEFTNGRKTTNPDYVCKCRKCKKSGNTNRMDHGLGMTKKSLTDGLKRAETHGFLVVDTDISDKARTRKIYSLNYKSFRGG